MFAAGRPVELHAVGQYLVVGLDALALGPFTSQPHRLQPQQPANYQQGDEEIFFHAVCKPNFGWCFEIRPIALT